MRFKIKITNTSDSKKVAVLFGATVNYMAAGYGNPASIDIHFNWEQNPIKHKGTPIAYGGFLAQLIASDEPLYFKVTNLDGAWKSTPPADWLTIKYFFQTGKPDYNVVNPESGYVLSLNSLTRMQVELQPKEAIEFIFEKVPCSHYIRQALENAGNRISLS